MANRRDFARLISSYARERIGWLVDFRAPELEQFLCASDGPAGARITAAIRELLRKHCCVVAMEDRS
jgi:hypothetical protein